MLALVVFAVAIVVTAALGAEIRHLGKQVASEQKQADTTSAALHRAELRALAAQGDHRRAAYAYSTLLADIREEADYLGRNHNPLVAGRLLALVNNRLAPRKETTR